MAAPAATAPFLPFTSSTQGRKIASSYSTTSALVIATPRNSRSRLNLGSAIFSGSTGLKHLGISFKRIETQKGIKCRDRRKMVVHASLFGVGAPEVLVIGVVALLVFGPKGLAEVARSLGKTLRAFQPTIRELQDVSNEFKSTIEREIGLDEIQSSLKNPYTPPANKNPEETAVDSKDDTQTTPKLPPVSMENLLKNSEEQLTSPPPASTASQEVSATLSTSEASANQEATAETDQSSPNKNTPIS